MYLSGLRRTLTGVTGSEKDEAALWRRAAEGDGGAFGALFDVNRGRVYTAAFRWAGVRSDAEDITASVFLELWRRRDAVRVVDGSVLPWLLVTTANVARNTARSRRRYASFLQQLPRETDARAAEEVALDGARLIDPELRAALARLPEQDAALLSMLAFEDMTITDAAAALGITVQAAKTRLHRARGRVRPLLPDLDPALRTLTPEGTPR